jgi:hypothetical protein
VVEDSEAFPAPAVEVSKSEKNPEKILRESLAFFAETAAYVSKRTTFS